ncbi:hypothetical protein Patl1_27955 [Pistacia atlantica]|uniref:Uncharacterized protein n=1 Tax=Pistacia atlantica TaxID=434234 RepID=A0ACC1BF44_9ROSI|nr:hypothetical protein Patl1_27955 [Pistacia atlantica]
MIKVIKTAFAARGLVARSLAVSGPADSPAPAPSPSDD